MKTLRDTLKILHIPIMDDGKISLGETSLILRQIQPFIAAGNSSACELRDMLQNVRKDGIITPDESNRIAWLLQKTIEGAPDLERHIMVVPDYPIPGEQYFDLSRLMDTPWLFHRVMERADDILSDLQFDTVVASNPCGTVFGAAIAARHHAGFANVYRGAKLPREFITTSIDGALGKSDLVMLLDSVARGERVLVVDDVLATGKTAAAIARMAEQAGGKVVKMLFVVEVEDFHARTDVLAGRDISSLAKVHKIREQK